MVSAAVWTGIGRFNSRCIWDSLCGQEFWDGTLRDCLFHFLFWTRCQSRIWLGAKSIRAGFVPGPLPTNVKVTLLAPMGSEATIMTLPSTVSGSFIPIFLENYVMSFTRGIAFPPLSHNCKKDWKEERVSRLISKRFNHFVCFLFDSCCKILYYIFKTLNISKTFWD